MKQPLLIPILHKDRECYQLVEPWSFECAGGIETVPEGFVADGASVPRILWPFMPPDGTHRAAALAHDWCYGNKGVMPGVFSIIKRKVSDVLFYDLMIRAGIGRFRAGTAYRGVRVGGKLAWVNSRGKPTIFPVRNAAPSSTLKKSAFKHLYAVGA